MTHDELLVEARKLGVHNDIVIYETLDTYCGVKETIAKITELLAANGVEDGRLEVESQYDDHVLQLRMQRPKTSEELERDIASKKKEVKEREEWDRKQYEALKKKFGDV